MRWLGKHIGLAKSLGEFQFKHWLDTHALEVLSEIGVKTDQVVLDFGCGSGTYTIPAAELVGREGRVYALDVSRKALARMEDKAKRRGLANIVRVDASGENHIPLKDETLDQILLIDVIQEIEDRESLFDEVYRILKPSGAVSIYPMHIAEEEIDRLATSRGFNLRDRIQGRILIFRKTSKPLKENQ